MRYTTIEKNLMDLARAKNCEIKFGTRIYKDKECFAHFDEDPILYIKNKDRTYFLCTHGALIWDIYDTGERYYPNEVLQLYPTDKKLMKLFAHCNDTPGEYCRTNYFVVYEVLHDANGNEYTESVDDFDFFEYNTVTEVVKAMLKNLF